MAATMSLSPKLKSVLKKELKKIKKITSISSIYNARTGYNNERTTFQKYTGYPKQSQAYKSLEIIYDSLLASDPKPIPDEINKLLEIEEFDVDGSFQLMILDELTFFLGLLEFKLHSELYNILNWIYTTSQDYVVYKGTHLNSLTTREGFFLFKFIEISEHQEYVFKRAKSFNDYINTYFIALFIIKLYDIELYKTYSKNFDSSIKINATRISKHFNDTSPQSIFTKSLKDTIKKQTEDRKSNDSKNNNVNPRMHNYHKALLSRVELKYIILTFSILIYTWLTDKRRVRKVMYVDHCKILLNLLISIQYINSVSETYLNSVKIESLILKESKYEISLKGDFKKKISSNTIKLTKFNEDDDVDEYIELKFNFCIKKIKSQLALIKNIYSIPKLIEKEWKSNLKSKSYILYRNFNPFKAESWSLNTDTIINIQKLKKTKIGDIELYLGLLKSYLDVFTMHISKWNIYDSSSMGDNYLKITFPRAASGQIMFDCGVYALFYYTAIKKIKKIENIQFIIFPLHIGTIATFDNKKVICHNSGIYIYNSENYDKYKAVIIPNLTSEELLLTLAGILYMPYIKLPYKIQRLGSTHSIDDIWKIYLNLVNNSKWIIGNDVKVIEANRDYWESKLLIQRSLRQLYINLNLVDLKSNTNKKSVEGYNNAIIKFKNSFKYFSNFKQQKANKSVKEKTYQSYSNFMVSFQNYLTNSVNPTITKNQIIQQNKTKMGQGIVNSDKSIFKQTLPELVHSEFFEYLKRFSIVKKEEKDSKIIENFKKLTDNYYMEKHRKNLIAIDNYLPIQIREKNPKPLKCINMKDIKKDRTNKDHVCKTLFELSPSELAF